MPLSVLRNNRLSSNSNKSEQGELMPVVTTTPAHARVPDAGACPLTQSALLDLIPDAACVQAPDGTIIYWNRGAEALFGISRNLALGQRPADLLEPAAALPPDALAQLHARGQWVGELDFALSGGHRLRVQRRCSVMRHADGQLAALLTVDTDVTEQRRAEKEIVLLNNLLEQRIARRTAELQESNEDLRGFAYSLAHDLRAPLASIDGFSAQLQERLEGSLDDRCRHYLRRVRSGVRMMSELTDGLLALADLSHTPLLHQGVDLSVLAHGSIERLREGGWRHHPQVEVNDTAPARGDRRLLSDVLENLLGNAWKFTSRTRDPRIRFSGAQAPGGHYVYCVEDNGAGFDPAYAHKLFGPFQRLHSADEFEGTGIGLALVRKIVSRHGGRIWAESTPGCGARFYFTLNEASPPVRLPG